MSYFRPMGDGPITSPSQLDPAPSSSDGGWNPGGGAVDIGTVTPQRVSCDELPADSPFRRPGSVCAPPPDDTSGGSIAQAFRDLISPAAAADGPPWGLILIGGGLAAYYLLKSKRKRQ